MSKRSRDRARQRPPRGRVAAAAPARRRVPRAAIMLAVGLAIAWGVFAIVRRASRPNSGAGADSVASLDAQEAFRRGSTLGREDRHMESLPYFRRAVEASEGWIPHWNYAAAMNNASIEVWDRHGVASPASRASIERLELIRRSLAEIAAAEQRAPDHHTIAMLEVVRGATLERWGFPIDALEAYRAARAADPESKAAPRAEAACLAALRGDAAPAATKP